MNTFARLTAAAASMAISFTALPANAGAVLERVLDAKTLKVATDASWAPQSFMNDKNEMDGFDIDVAKEIGKRLGVGVEFVTPGWDIITAGNWQGRWDMHVGSMTPTKERAKIFDFPAVYYYTPAAVAVHNDRLAVTLIDLDGKVVGTRQPRAEASALPRSPYFIAAQSPGRPYEIPTGAGQRTVNCTQPYDLP